jgi:hypothetical protein
MIALLDGGDVTLDDVEAPETARLRASVDTFVASLATAHPRLSFRSPVSDVEHIATLLFMYLDHCRELLAAYDSLTGVNAVWVFEPSRRAGDDDDMDEDEAGDDDIPF